MRPNGTKSTPPPPPKKLTLRATRINASSENSPAAYSAMSVGRAAAHRRHATDAPMTSAAQSRAYLIVLAPVKKATSAHARGLRVVWPSSTSTKADPVAPQMICASTLALT
jgi:hypothetical protein